MIEELIEYLRDNRDLLQQRRSDLAQRDHWSEYNYKEDARMLYDINQINGWITMLEIMKP